MNFARTEFILINNFLPHFCDPFLEEKDKSVWENDFSIVCVL